MSSGLGFLCKLWALSTIRVSRWLAPGAALVSLRGRYCWVVMMFFPTEQGAPGNPLVLEAKPIYRLDETTWTWTPLDLWWFEFYPAKSLQSTFCPVGCCCGLQCSHQPHSTPYCWWRFPPSHPSPWPCSSLCVTTHSSWSSETNSGASPLVEALWKPPYRISHVFSCTRSTVHVNDNAYKVAMIPFLTTALLQTSL